jgi:hypothetical protein
MLEGKTNCVPNHEFYSEWEGEYLFTLELDGKLLCLLCYSTHKNL